MTGNDAQILRPVAGVYFGMLAIAGAACVLFLYTSGGAEVSGWKLTAILFSFFAILGAALLYMLQKIIACPVKCVADLSDRLLNGTYSEMDRCSSYALGGLIESVNRLGDEFKKNLGFNRSILEGLPIGCCIVDISEKITFLNQECMDMIGSPKSPEAYYGRTLSQLFYNDDRKALIGYCMEENRRETNREAIFKHTDGSDINVLANLFPLHDIEGNVIGGCCLYIITTELKKREAQITNQNERISAAAEKADEVVNELSEAAARLHEMVGEARSGAVVQNEQTVQTAAAIEQMNATVLEVARNAQEAAGDADKSKKKAEDGARIVGEAIEAINVVAGQAKTLKESMEDLDSRSKEIGNVLGVIEDIADQTNLLALNAAIEAARAGEAGRGFAVVADEVRKLAEKTVQATAEVHKAVSGIQDGAKANVRATEEAVRAVTRSTELAGNSGNALSEIVTMSESTADRIRHIATAAEQQASASEQINQSAVEVSRISGKTEKAMLRSTEVIGNLSNLAGELSGIISDMQ
ncbi:methyl-accepting chemotaxis protein [Maridesulfovibrio sp.]|uniref:methyl-accepting chemotaxis protein n=1 Tax=Maridesulfovibrio sp. TaxID=2795000 RepID=UPI002A18A6C5|nr:methyl-accepting chemotaxis protein [Maridesulfovibrio sp.]